MDKIKVEVENALMEAGSMFLNAVFDREPVKKEGTANFATYIDYSVQEFLFKRLQVIIPGSNIIREETDNNLYDLSKPTWILDPVDGTINLYHSYMHSCISVGLYFEKKPVLGMVYNPYNKELFSAEEGKGAYLNGQKIMVSRRCFSDGLVGFGTTPYDRSNADRTFGILGKVFMNCQDIRRSGSAALDIAYVACGRMDGFFEMSLQPWDYAAGILILKEAGGEISNWDGGALDPVHPDSVLATNGLIHKAMLKCINDI